MMKYCKWTIALFAAVSFSLVFAGSAPSEPKVPSQIQDFSRVKGYMIKLGEFKAGSFETPPYIPKKIRFELELELKKKKLLAPESETKALTVNITSSTYYKFYTSRVRASDYSELTSVVEVVDTKQPENIAKNKIYGYNLWGEQTSDFTEIDHAKQISEFLESIVR